eukprot:CAMPEP_0184657548 /NCGR_PEP_ID=MMETSP0308-20130426/20300_1 /TAXON_ID=38269 /ORGANISM="Gloeochaete witrockiana, Strain SAG 46.84" /LENGTH=149 /DNA_ID=CAMNT_0027095519 /DNA_START=243 /DNA_END=692 /DNA_ORIENTATION=-
MDNAELLFTFGNNFVLPFWALLLLAPRWEWTKKIMFSNIQFVLLALAYIYLIFYSASPESTAAFGSDFSLEIIAKAFSDPKVMAAGWTHYLVVDLWAGRFIAYDGMEQGVPFRHSIFLCLLFGPVGVLSHIVTSFIWIQLLKKGTASQS